VDIITKLKLQTNKNPRYSLNTKKKKKTKKKVIYKKRNPSKWCTFYSHKKKKPQNDKKETVDRSTKGYKNYSL
jgi:hypothetical protein